MIVKVRVTGMAALDRRLTDLKNRTRKSVLQRALKKAAVPIVNAARAAAPVGDGDLAASIVVSTRLTARQAGQAQGEPKSTAMVYIGPSSDGSTGVLNYAAIVEFGRAGVGPRAFLRPALDSAGPAAVALLTNLIGAEIDKALRRGTGR